MYLTQEIKVPLEAWPRREDWTGTVVEVYKKSGDTVKKGEPIMEIEIEKAILVIESPNDGIIEIRVKKGDTVTPDTILATIKQLK